MQPISEIDQQQAPNNSSDTNAGGRHGAPKPIADLFAIADANGPRLAERFATLLASFPTAEQHILRRFTRQIRDAGRVAVNMRQSVLNSFLTFGEHQNIYEQIAWRAKSSSKSLAELLRQRLGDFCERRLTFDATFVDGHRFRYGALNLGGLGATHFGDCCVVLTKERMRRPPIAYLRADSLVTYVAPGQPVDLERLRRDAAPSSQRHCLAALKHAADVVTTAPAGWAKRVSSRQSFIEAIFAGPLTPDAVAAVRLSRDDYELRFHHVFEELRGRLDEATRFQVEEFAMVWRHLDEKKIPLLVC